MKLRNISPLGELDLPLVGRILTAGEIFDVDDELAGRAPSIVVDEDTGEQRLDPGEGLLAQVGNYEAVSAGPPSNAWKRDELLAHARAVGLDVEPDATKKALLAAIEAGPSNPEEIS